MDEQGRVLLLLLLPAIVPQPPDNYQNINELLNFLSIIINRPPFPWTNIRFRNFIEDENVYAGRDVFDFLADNRYQFYLITGETPETFEDLLTTVALPVDRDYILSVRNRSLLFLIWLRMYPTYTFLAAFFNISVSTVGKYIDSMIPYFLDKLQHYIQWPTPNEWRSMQGEWSGLPMAVGAIDGTSHEILRPDVEPQEFYYSGNRCFHCIHSQVIVDTFGTIRYIESGYSGHLNDAQQYGLRAQVGEDLPFPNGLVLLGDKIYPNRDPLITPYTSAQLLRKEPGERRKCRKLNRRIRQYGISVEHGKAELKVYKSISSIWRQSRRQLSCTVNICASLVCRRKSIELIL